jgi:hypothetical protein
MTGVTAVTVLLCLSTGSLLLAWGGSSPAAQAATIERKPLPSRQAFARQMDKVQKGMTRKQVLALLGKPDQVIHTPGFDGCQTWLYGCAGPDAVPTLGQVCFDAKGKVSLPPSGQGTPPSATVISEPELRRALCLLDHTPPLRGYEFDPLALIRVVNGLLPLGKEKALAAIEEYPRVLRRDDRPRPYHGEDTMEGLFLVLRCLFEGEPLPPNGLATGKGFSDMVPRPSPTPQPAFWPPLNAGASSPPEPADPTLVPRFPLVLIDDIPLVLVSGYLSAGCVSPDPFYVHVAYFREWGRLRTRPLRPSDRPWEALSKLEASAQWLYGRRYLVGSLEPGQTKYHQGTDAEEGQRMLQKQLLHLVVALYPNVLQMVHSRSIDNGKETDSTYEEVDESRWETVVADLKEHPIRWNAAHNRYERTPATAAPTSLPSRQTGTFSDVPTDNPSERAMERLRQAGILVGYPPGSIPEDLTAPD